MGEMKAGGWGGDRTLGASEDRLVIATVPRIAPARPFDVRRQRRRAVTGEHLAECSGRKIEAQAQVALRVFLGDVRDKTVAKRDRVSGSQTARAFRKGTPKPAAQVAVECHLDRGLAAAANQP